LLGVHYPTDITAGAFLGATIGGICLMLKATIEKARAAKAAAAKAPSPTRHDPPATNAPGDPSP
jgi:membrane-associated phospholipid phosphatase